jgi:predicted MPP superfamily phosphohydrolase
VNFFIFLAVVLSIYTAMHGLVFWGIYPLFSGHASARIAVGAWMVLMIVAPVAVHMLEDRGLELPAQILAWVGYAWMGLIFLAFWVFLIVGLYELINWLLSHGISAVPRYSFRSAASATVIIVLVVAAGFYGFMEALNIRVEKVAIASDKLPPGADPIRIAQVSDIHLGLMNRQGKLADIVLKLHVLDPDLLVATGDVVDGEIGHLDGLSDLWNTVDPPLGKYAVTGNHEVYAGLKGSIDFLKRSGFTVLRNESRLVNAQLVLAGVDDEHLNVSEEQEMRLLESQPENRFVLFLKHRPVVLDKTLGLFDLQVSGHAHKGQIFPFNLITRLEYPRQNGLYPLSNGSRLYASRGTGTWGPPMRIGSPPEITLFEIVPATEAQPEKGADA